MKRTSTVVQSDVLPLSLKEVRQWKNGTPHPQDDFLINGVVLDLLIKELGELRARLDAFEKSLR